MALKRNPKALAPHIPFHLLSLSVFYMFLIFLLICCMCTISLNLMTLWLPLLKLMLPCGTKHRDGWLVSNVIHMAYTISLHRCKCAPPLSLHWWFMLSWDILDYQSFISWCQVFQNCLVCIVSHVSLGNTLVIHFLIESINCLRLLLPLFIQIFGVHHMLLPVLVLNILLLLLMITHVARGYVYWKTGLGYFLSFKHSLVSLSDLFTMIMLANIYLINFRNWWLQKGFSIRHLVPVLGYSTKWGGCPHSLLPL